VALATLISCFRLRSHRLDASPVWVRAFFFDLADLSSLTSRYRIATSLVSTSPSCAHVLALGKRLPKNKNKGRRWIAFRRNGCG
jgi:hypothetical protein